jgi:hypothetical protein
MFCKLQKQLWSSAQVAWRQTISDSDGADMHAMPVFSSVPTILTLHKAVLHKACIAAFAMCNLNPTCHCCHALAAVNDAPTAVQGSFITPQDTPLSISLAALASDVDGDALTFDIVNGPSHCTVDSTATAGTWQYTPSLNYNGTWQYTPSLNYNGTWQYMPSLNYNGTWQYTPSLNYNGTWQYTPSLNYNGTWKYTPSLNYNGTWQYTPSLNYNGTWQYTPSLNYNGTWQYTPSLNYNGT